MNAETPRAGARDRLEGLLFALALACFALAWAAQSRALLLAACGLAIAGHAVGLCRRAGRV